MSVKTSWPITALLILATSSAFASGGTINVYVCYDKVSGSYVTLTEDEYRTTLFLKPGMIQQTKTFAAFNDPAPGRVAVDLWNSPNGEHRIQVREGQFTDEQLSGMGFSLAGVRYYIPLESR